jgi:hypothetical protein
MHKLSLIGLMLLSAICGAQALEASGPFSPRSDIPQERTSSPTIIRTVQARECGPGFSWCCSPGKCGCQKNGQACGAAAFE